MGMNLIDEALLFHSCDWICEIRSRQNFGSHYFKTPRDSVTRITRFACNKKQVKGRAVQIGC